MERSVRVLVAAILRWRAAGETGDKCNTDRVELIQLCLVHLLFHGPLPRQSSQPVWWYTAATPAPSCILSALLGRSARSRVRTRARTHCSADVPARHASSSDMIPRQATPLLQFAKRAVGGPPGLPGRRFGQMCQVWIRCELPGSGRQRIALEHRLIGRFERLDHQRSLLRGQAPFAATSGDSEHGR
jgi:hypothetical protein